MENVILRHPKVAWCAVVSSPDPVYTERVTAVVVLRPGLEGSEDLAEEIKEFCRGKLAPFKLPRKVDFARELPFVGSGKVDKKRIRAMYWKDRKFKV
ncbi:MAG: AMP-binding enzyme [Bacillota bacterium]